LFNPNILKKHLLYLFLILFIGIRLSADIEGSLINQYGGGVVNADINITHAGDDNILISTTTDSSGMFTASLSDANLLHSQLFPSYPNPSKGSAVLPLYLLQDGDVDLSVFNLRGEKISSRSFSQLSSGFQQIAWQARDDHGRPLPLGLYIIRLEASDHVSSIKILVIDHNDIHVSPAAIEQFIPQYIEAMEYDLHVNFMDGESTIIENVMLIPGISNVFYVNEAHNLPFKAEGDHLKVFRNGIYEPIFLKGVNLGVAVPGTQPGEMAASREQYIHWLHEIADAGLNYIRTYTLHYPRFYEELENYNLANPNKPIYLLQGVWLDEEYEADLITSQTEKFDDDIEEIVDCLHGNRVVSHRYGRAYGTYAADVSPWLFGYIIGREIYPWEVILLEVMYPDSNEYIGTSISIQDTLPIDVWMTGRLDHLVTYQRNVYQTERPVSVSSWPTLDPLIHPTEDPERTEEDIAVMDMSKINCHHAPAGFFMSYHAYPYYPDFISDDPGYQAYSDSIGPNSYIGYLEDLKDHYDNIPLLIAEFGVPSSWGNAHFAFSGMHHGGFSEFEQGEINVRLLNNIYDTGCAGGLLFSWIDEWFKNSWITAPFGSDASRRPFWHNVTTPEQNYGIIGFKEPEPTYLRWGASSGNSTIDNIICDMDNAYFYAKIELEQALLLRDTVWVAFDTYRADLGESILLNEQQITNRAEFLLAVNSSNISPMYVTEAYDLYGIWHNTSSASQLFHSIASDNALWNPIRWKTNFYEWSYQEIGLLRTAKEDDVLSSLDGVRIENKVITLRIPWSLLQFTDPSMREVMDDDRSTWGREEAISDGISLSVSYKGELVETERFIWDNWSHLDNLIDYEKASYDIFVKGASKVPSIPR
jgi:hypothetical protein